MIRPKERKGKEMDRFKVKELLVQREEARRQGRGFLIATDIALGALENHLKLHETLLSIISCQENHKQTLILMGFPEDRLHLADEYAAGLKKAAKMLADNYPFQDLG